VEHVGDYQEGGKQKTISWSSRSLTGNKKLWELITEPGTCTNKGKEKRDAHLPISGVRWTSSARLAEKVPRREKKTSMSQKGEGKKDK